MKNIVLWTGILIIGVFSCSDHAHENTISDNKIENTQEKIATYTPVTLQKIIAQLELKAADLDTPNHNAVIESLILHYRKYSRAFGNDSLAPEMLFRAGNQSVYLEKYLEAVSFYSQVEKHYPEYFKRPECIFLQGFVFESYLNEFGKAKEKYESLIKQYPNHQLAYQAQKSIEFLGISDEDRIKMFEKAAESIP